MSEPLRMCLGCRTHAVKTELYRIVRTPSGEVCLDTRERLPGRGAYLCKNRTCIQKIQKTKALERSLKTAIAPEFYEKLIDFLGDAHG